MMKKARDGNSDNGGRFGVWNDFFYARTSNLAFAHQIRRAFAVITVVCISLLVADWDFFERVLPTLLARLTIDSDTITILEYIPDEYHKFFLYIWMLHAIVLGLGIAPRWQACAVYFWYNQFYHHNNLIWDAEDNVLRLMAFFIIFFPPPNAKSWPMWPFRLMQYQCCLIFFSTVCSKLMGEPWRDGTVMYNIVQLDAFYGGYFNPDFLFGYTRPLKFLTYFTLVLEVVGPITVWFRETRFPTLVLFWMFHLAVDASMNLHCFHWAMIVLWSSFLLQPDDESKQLSIVSILGWMTDNFRVSAAEDSKKDWFHPRSD